MDKHNAMKLMAAIGFVCFSLNAATIHVAKGTADSLIGKAVKSSSAKDTILVGKGTFLDTVAIDHPLTIIGVSKDSTLIGRADHDSSGVPTIRITGKNIVIKKVSILGHNAIGTTNELDTLTCWPTSDAVVLSGAESVSIASCNLIGGNGIAQHSAEAARGGSAVIIKKGSKWITLKNDSIQGGIGNRSRILGDTLIEDLGVKQPKVVLGVAGFGIGIDTSSFVKVDSSEIVGGNSTGLNWNGMHNPPVPGLVCFYAESIAVSAATLSSGHELYTENLYTSDYELRDRSFVIFIDCNFYKNEGVTDETSDAMMHSTGVLLPFANNSKVKKSFAITTRNTSSGALLLSCFLTKPSLVSIDLLNAKGQAISHIQRKNLGSGMHEFTMDLKGNRMSTLSSSAYFLKVATSENRQCFRLIATK
jgi:hypothetical protein